MDPICGHMQPLDCCAVVLRGRLSWTDIMVYEGPVTLVMLQFFIVIFCTEPLKVIAVPVFLPLPMVQSLIVIVSTVPPEVIAVPPAACQAKASKIVQYHVGTMMHCACGMLMSQRLKSRFGAALTLGVIETMVTLSVA